MKTLRHQQITDHSEIVNGVKLADDSIDHCLDQTVPITDGNHGQIGYVDNFVRKGSLVYADLHIHGEFKFDPKLERPFIGFTMNEYSFTEDDLILVSKADLKNILFGGIEQ